MYHAFACEFNCVGAAGRRDCYRDLHRQAVSEIEPIEICGEKGDVGFISTTVVLN